MHAKAKAAGREVGPAREPAQSRNSILTVCKILQRLPGITGSIETGPTYKNVWTTGAHGRLEDGLHFMLQLTVAEAAGPGLDSELAPRHRRPVQASGGGSDAGLPR